MSEDGPDLRHARTVDGVTIAYQAIGQGPPVVWLPSLSNVRAQWRVPVLRRAYEHLARTVQLVLYDGRGTGSSDRRVDPADLGLNAHLRDLGAVVAAEGLQRFGLLGYYHSVATAIAYAADHPERVTRMVLFGGAARMREAMSPAQTQALLSLIDQDWDLFADTAAHAWMGWGAGDNGRLVADGFRTAATPTMAKAWFAEAEFLDVTDLLPRVAAPALVLHRQGERQIPPDVSRRLAHGLPHGQLLELAGSTPTLFMEHGRGDLELVIRYFTTGEVMVPSPPVPGEGLTARERDVLRLIAAGDSNYQIANRLGITEHTVERHASNLYRKIGARGRADATAHAVRHGLT